MNYLFAKKVQKTLTVIRVIGSGVRGGDDFPKRQGGDTGWGQFLLKSGGYREKNCIFYPKNGIFRPLNLKKFPKNYQRGDNLPFFGLRGGDNFSAPRGGTVGLRGGLSMICPGPNYMYDLREVKSKFE